MPSVKENSRIQQLPQDLTLCVPSAYEAPIPGKTDKDALAISFNDTLNWRFFNFDNPSVLALKHIKIPQQSKPNDQDTDSIDEGTTAVMRPTAPYSQEAYMIISKLQSFFEKNSSAPLYYYPHEILAAHYETAITIGKILQTEQPDTTVLLMTNSMQHVSGTKPDAHPLPDEYLDPKTAETVRAGTNKKTTKSITLPHTHIVLISKDSQKRPQLKDTVTQEEAEKIESEIIENARSVRQTVEYKLEKKVIRLLLQHHKEQFQKLIFEYLPQELQQMFPEECVPIQVESKPPGYSFVLGESTTPIETIPYLLKAHYFALKRICSELFNYHKNSPEPFTHIERFHLRHNHRIVPQPSYKEIIEFRTDEKIVAYISPLVFAKVGPIEALELNLVRLQHYQEQPSETTAAQNAHVIQMVEELGFKSRKDELIKNDSINDSTDELTSDSSFV